MPVVCLYLSWVPRHTRCSSSAFPHGCASEEGRWHQLLTERKQERHEEHLLGGRLQHSQPQTSGLPSFSNWPFCCYSLVPLLQSAQICSVLSSLLHHTQPCMQPCLEAVPTPQLTRASYLRRLSVSPHAQPHSTDAQAPSLQQQIVR